MTTILAFLGGVKVGEVIALAVGVIVFVGACLWFARHPKK